MASRYYVYFTPRTDADSWGTEVDVSDFAKADDLSSIILGIDSTDYDVGVFRYSDLTLSMENSEGRFGDQFDSRSMFPFSRDLTKVRIVYEDDDGTTSTYRGIIFDEGTRCDFESDLVTLRILGRDSVLKKATVPVGGITDGTTFENALIAILNSDEIISLLNFDASDINVVYNGTIDVGSYFDGKNKQDAVNELLFASHSILYIDESDNIIVKNRDESAVDELELFGAGDLEGRENIIKIADYNTGLQRVFNVVKVNDTVVEDTDSVAAFGARKKEVSFDFVTSAVTAEAIANAVISEWKNLKTELRVTVRTKLAKDYTLFDRVSVDFPLRYAPAGQFFPITDITAADDAASPTPYAYGSVVIDPNLAFKIIEKSENPIDFTTELKLRVIGTGASDGYFS